jgi:glycosyltransferase involved in cell wall biosynthesis
VATDIRGCREEVVDGVTGFIVPRQDAAGLGRALLRLVSDPALARTMGEAGRRRAVAEFDEVRVVAQQVSSYRRLMAQRGVFGHHSRSAEAAQ